MDLGNLYARTRAAVEAQRRLAKASLQTPIWEGRKIVIYGAGGFGRDIARILSERGADLLGFLDRKGTGQTVWRELRAYSLDSDEARQWLGQNPVVIIGVFNYAVSIRELAEALRGRGFCDILTPMEYYPHLSGALGLRYWLGTSSDYAEALPSIEKAYSLWADDESRRLFLETLLFRIEADVNALAAITGQDCQYADPTVPRFSESLNMIDGGAFLGDSVECLIRHGYEIKRLYAFEPDLANFQQLRSSVAKSSPQTSVSLWPCGVWSSTSYLRFSADASGASRLSETGSVVVPVVALDEVLIHQPVNLIKLDVEGAEPESLRGASRIIQTHRPGLAVCLYHFPHHLWSIPLWVNDLDLGYRLYYRAHQENSFDTVLYAISDV
jgi:FkbM family methyltransferase